MTNKTKAIIGFSSFIMLFIVGVMAYFIHSSRQQLNEMTQQYEIEKEQLADEYSQLAIQYEGYQLNVNNDMKTSTGVSVHPSTVRRPLSAVGLKGCVADQEEPH